MSNVADSKSAPRISHTPKYWATVLLVSLIALGACVLASLALGSRMVGWTDLMNGLFHPSIDTYETNIVHKRIPRTVFCLMCGGALGIAGALMQSVTRNPIADPSILGVNTGAALFVVIGIAFLNISTANEYIWLAMAGAAVTAVFVFGIGSMGRGGATPIKLILAGAATSAALSSLVSAIMIPRSNVMDTFRFWQVGSVGAGTWDVATTLVPFLIVGIIVGILAAPALNAMALGDDAATGLGVRPGVIRLVAAAAAVILCGAVTALAGPIAFVGLIGTHLVRLLLGPDMRYVIPMSAVAGATILMLSDVIGRVAGSPGELEVGVVTAFIGAPILIFLAIRTKVRSL